MNNTREPKVLLMKLTERMSQKGMICLSGWSKARLTGFVDAEPDEHGNLVWSEYAVEPQPRAAATRQLAAPLSPRHLWAA